MDQQNDESVAVTEPEKVTKIDERQRMRVDTAELKSSYCNVCNGSATREEVVLNFGINHDWDRGERDYDIKLLHRIVLSPYAAKRVATLLESIVKDYENRFGALK